MDKEELKRELDKKDEIIDALSSAVKNNKADVKTFKAEIEKLRLELKRRDDLQNQMQNDIDELKIEVAKERSKTQSKNNKADVKKFKAEIEKLGLELKRRDDLQNQMQNDIDELKIEVAKERSKTQRCTCQQAKAEKGSDSTSQLDRFPDLELGSESFYSYERNRELEFGSESLRSYDERKPKTMSSVKPMDKNAHKSQAKGFLVAAIDFGNTHSGYAYSFKDDYSNDPLKIVTYNWLTGSRSLVTTKTPSTILLDENKKFVAFGYEAENKYIDLILDEEHEKFYYFRRFVGLFSEASASGLRKDTVLRDNFNKTIPALALFSMAIEYICDHLMESLTMRLARSVKVNEITWVLTVPAILNDGVKQMVRKAALSAGIDNANLTIALEPEAASLFCMSLPVTQFNDNKGTIGSAFPDGTKYMMLDVGGELVKMSIYKVVNRTTLTELNRASGGACGSTSVDECFKQLLVNITGRIPFDKFCLEHYCSYVVLLREFESRKRAVKSGTTTKETFHLPRSLLHTYKDVTQKEIKEAVDNCAPYKGKLTLVGGDKLRIDANVFKSLFDESISNIIQHAKNMLGQKASAGTDTIVLVGGFSENAFLQEAIRRHFSGKRVIIPEEAGLTVVKGAVLFGHNPRAVRS